MHPRQGIRYDHWQVMAHSFGTTIGLYYAQAFPGTVSDLALVSPVPLDRSFDRNMAELMQLRITRKTASTEQPCLAMVCILPD